MGHFFEWLVWGVDLILRSHDISFKGVKAIFSTIPSCRLTVYLRVLCGIVKNLRNDPGKASSIV